MLHFPSRCGVFALALAAGFALARTAPAQIVPATDTAHTDAQRHHIAPHDTFYVLDYASVRTDKGVEGFPPGTEVRLVSVDRDKHTLTVTDGHANLELPPEKLTNDMDIAALIKAKDNANQEKVAAYQRAQAEAYQKYQKEVAEYTAKDLEKRQQAIRDANNRAQENADAERGAQPVNASANASSNGYYNQGGNGYGSPYGYLIDLNTPIVQNGNAPATNTTNQSGGNRGAISSQNAAPANSAVQKGGVTSGGTAGAGGGKKP